MSYERITKNHVLTDSKAAMLLTIADFIAVKGFSPSVRELADLRWFRSLNAVCEQLQWLKREGYIEWERGKSRTIRVVPDKAPPPELRLVRSDP